MVKCIMKERIEFTLNELNLKTSRCSMFANRIE